MRRIFSDYLEKLKYASESWSKIQLSYYALACCERQLSIYKKASDCTSWNKFDILAENMKSAWTRLESVSFSAAKKCENCAPPEASNDVTSAASDVAFSIGATMRFIASNRREYALGSAEISFNLIDALIYSFSDMDINENNDTIVDVHQVMVSELERQKQDFLDVQLYRDNPDDLRSILRNRSKGASLAGELWFFV